VLTAIVPHGGLDRGPYAVFLAHICRDRYAVSAGLRYDQCSLFAGCGVDLGNDDLAPFADIGRAVARPMPVPAPVINATLPSSRAMDTSPLVR
jgi:hypothetical protein